jgi:glycosyltransferase involved in cell wall biosynthesis
MKVLLVCSKYLPEYAGAGLRIHRTYARLRAHIPIDLRVICSSTEHTSWRSETYAIDGLKVTRIASPFKRRLLNARAGRVRLAKALWYILTGIDEGVRTARALQRHRDVDVVHTVGHSWSGGVAAIWAAICGKRIVREVVTMGSRPDDPPGLRWGVRQALRRRGTIVAISPRLAAVARALGFDRIWSRPNPVDETRFGVDRAARDTLRERYTPFGPGDIVLVELSKYSRVKNKTLPVRMLPLLPRQFKLVVAGPFDAAEQTIYDTLEALVDELGVGDRVALQRGFVEHPEHYYQLADVFLFPSVSDGLGTPVLEAIACGVPVVAHRLPGVTDAWLVEGRSGFLAEPTPAAFAKAVERAITLSRETLDAEASALRRRAGASVIDAQYLSLLQGHGTPDSPCVC